MTDANGPTVELHGTEVKESKKPESLTPEELLLRVNQVGEDMRALIVAAKRLPRPAVALDPHQDPVRSIALSQAHLQTGFMWLRRAIEVPKVF